MEDTELCSKCHANSCMPQRTICRQCRSAQEAARRFAHFEMCEYCGERPRIKQRKRCETCDPLCRNCNINLRIQRNYYCAKCKNEKLRVRYANDPTYKEAATQRMYAWKRANLKEVRALVNAMYGGKCACCGESQPIFLSVDHVFNDGAERRRASSREFNTITLLRDLLRHGSPQGDYQLLCFNCNLGKHINGGVCPHRVPVPESNGDEEPTSLATNS